MAPRYSKRQPLEDSNRQSSKNRGRRNSRRHNKYLAIEEPKPLIKEHSTILMPQWLLELKQRQEARAAETETNKSKTHTGSILEETPVHTFSGQSPPIILATHTTYTAPANSVTEVPRKKSKKKKVGRRKNKKGARAESTRNKSQTTSKESVELVRVPSKLQMLGRSEEERDYDLELIQMPQWLIAMAKRAHEQPAATNLNSNNKTPVVRNHKQSSPRQHFSPAPLTQPVILGSSLEPPRPMARAQTSPPIIISHCRSSAPRYPVAPRHQIEQRIEMVRVPSVITNLKPREESPVTGAMLYVNPCCGSPHEEHAAHVRSPLALLRKFQQLVSPLSSQSPQPLTVLTQKGHCVSIFQDSNNLPRNSRSVPVVARPHVHRMRTSVPLVDDEDDISSLSSDEDDHDGYFHDPANRNYNVIPHQHRQRQPSRRVLGDITSRVTNHAATAPSDEEKLIAAHYAKWRSRHGREKNMEWSRNLRQHSTPDQQVYVFQ